VRRRTLLLGAAAVLFVPTSSLAQVAPSGSEIAAYEGLHAAAASGDVSAVRAAAGDAAKLEARDDHGRTPLHVAAHMKQHAAMRELVRAGADANALDSLRYDIVTIAAVADDVPTLLVALEIGASPANVTSPWNGTALIAAAHLGHDGIVRELINAGAPLDHVNSLGWTALIEAVVLGDGGSRHQATAEALVKAGADVTLSDRNGQTPLMLAKARGYDAMVRVFGVAP
jgi:uncharacterized protein